MAPVYSKLLATNRVAERIWSHVSSFPQPIAFARSRRASAKHKATGFREFEMRFDPSDKKAQKTKNKSVLTNEDGNQEMWCEWREKLDELYQFVPLTTGTKGEDSRVALMWQDFSLIILTDLGSNVPKHLLVDCTCSSQSTWYKTGYVQQWTRR
jgi:hypothetical protein